MADELGHGDTSVYDGSIFRGKELSVKEARRVNNREKRKPAKKYRCS
jgi:hypothetical protein